MALSLGRNSSSLGTALVAVVGTQVLGREWGSGRLVPTIVGVAAAAVAVYVLLARRG